MSKNTRKDSSKMKYTSETNVKKADNAKMIRRFMNRIVKMKLRN